MNKYYERYLQYRTLIDDKLFNLSDKELPATLYEPVKYVLSAGGKRIRPMILISSCEAFGGTIEESLDAAAAIEILHNFTLVHDDIMDNAGTRRGMETVHKKWDTNIAILAGDCLMGIAYKLLLNTKSDRIGDIAKAFTEGVIEVCEGQSFDKEFEKQENVKLSDYTMMIGKKTSMLLETCAVIGVMIAGGTNEQIELMRDYAKNIGLAFQVQDDLLDITADEKEFGKKIGGDLMEGKKTFLLLKALEVVEKPEDRALLNKVSSKNGHAPINENDIMKIKDLYEAHGVLDYAKSEVEIYTQKADAYLSSIPDSEAKEMLKWFSLMLLGRSS